MKKIVYGRVLMCVLCAAACLMFAGLAYAKDKPSPPGFTISKVDTDPKAGKIMLHFTDTVTTSSLEEGLKIYPPVNVHWYEAELSGDNVVTLHANFRPGQTYKLTLPDDYASANNKPYKKGVSSFDMPNLPPELALPEPGTVIERDSRQMLHVQVTNVDMLRFRGLQLPPVMLPRAVEYAKEKQKDRQWDDMLGSITGGYEAIEKALKGDSDFKAFLRPVTFDSQAFLPGRPMNEVHIFSIPLDFRAAREKGAIELVLIDSGKKEQAARVHPQVFRVTDMGLTYKLSGGGLLVWATSLHTGKPLEGASVLAFTKDNAAVYLGRTGEDGTLLTETGTNLKAISLNQPAQGINKRAFDATSVVFIAAVTDTDASYIEVTPTGNIRPEEGIKQTRDAYAKPSSRNGEVFTERGIYRPGDTVYFKGTVRENMAGTVAPPAGLECTFTIMNSHDEQVYQKKLNLSEFGTASESFRVEKYMPLGEYTLKMKYEPDEADAASTTMMVQEFKPPRHFTRMSFKRETRPDDSYVNLKRTADYLICTIEGRYYAGGPVKNGRVRWTAYRAKTEYERAGYDEFTFGQPYEGKDEVLESGESMLGADGKVSVAIPVGRDVASCVEGVSVTATVVDFDGRAASGTAVYQEESDTLVGINRHPESVHQGDTQSLRVVVVDKKGKRVKDGTLTARVMENDWTSIPKRNTDGEVYWESQRLLRQRYSADIPIKDSVAAFEFNFVWGGTYLVTFTYKADGRSYTSGTMYKVEGYYDYNDYSRDENSVQRLALSPDKEAYKPGDTMKVYMSLRRPMSSVLLTIERGGVIERRTLNLKPGQKIIEIPVKESYAPNVYVSVMGTLARDEFPMYTGQFDTDAPSYLYGVANVEVRRETEGLKLSVNPETKTLKSLPGAEMTLNLSCLDKDDGGVEGELAVCVVDESVLALTGFITPKLDDLSSFDQPLSVFTGELRAFLMRQTPYDFLKAGPLTGGDGALQQALSKVRKDFNPVAYFNPAVHTGKDGKAQVKFTFPDTMTEYRIYVVACDKGSRFGSFERSAVVVKEFYLEPGLPRFFTKGDAFTFDVSAFNKTESSGDIKFSVQSLENLSLKDSGGPYKVNAQDSLLIPVKGSALRPGLAEVNFAGALGVKGDAVLMKLPVNSGYMLDRDVSFGVFTGKTDIIYALPKGTKDIPWETLNPDELQATLTISGSPFLRMVDAFKYMLHYPYGCVEQTSSGVIALAGLRGVASQGLIPDITASDTDKFITVGIDRLFSMQTDSGGFAYWAGETHSNPWGTIYASYALTICKQAGFTVPQDRMDKAMTFLSLNRDIRPVGESDVRYKAYASYILALNGKLEAGAITALSQGLEKSPNREASVLTLLAAKASGQMKDNDIKTLATMTLGQFGTKPPATDSSNWYGWHGFYAPYREYALALIAASEILPGSKEADDAAKRLLAGMDRRGIWTSTSDTGVALIALGKYFGRAKFGKAPVKGQVIQGGDVAGSFTIGPTETYTVGLDLKRFLKNPEAKIVTDSQGALLYRMSLVFPRADYADKGFENGFAIHKEIKNLDGTDHIKLGDVVEVKVRIETKRQSYAYVVIDDPLPAGLVAINSALKTEERVPGGAGGAGNSGGDDEEYWWSYWDRDGFYNLHPNHVEMRDDRVLAFIDSMWKGIYQYSYYARAVCVGEFVMPSTKVQLMYEPDVSAYTPQGKLVIEPNK